MYKEIQSIPSLVSPSTLSTYQAIWMTSGYLSEDIESIYSGYSQLSSSSRQQIVECFSIFILPINGYGIQFNFDRYHITTYMNYRVLYLTNLKLFQEIFHLLINVTPHTLSCPTQ